MTEYSKEIYPLKNKSKEGVQHYGFFILVDGVKHIRQWHTPKVVGHVFMTKDEANTLADNMIVELSAPDHSLTDSTPSSDSTDMPSITERIQILQEEIDILKSQIDA